MEPICSEFVEFLDELVRETLESKTQLNQIYELFSTFVCEEFQESGLDVTFLLRFGP
jgi:hypothetical protein